MGYISKGMEGSDTKNQNNNCTWNYDHTIIGCLGGDWEFDLRDIYQKFIDQ